MTWMVTLAGDEGPSRLEHVDAETPALAANLAERMNPACRAIAVSQTLVVLGRCESCGGTIFNNEKPRERRGKLRCSGCL